MLDAHMHINQNPEPDFADRSIHFFLNAVSPREWEHIQLLADSNPNVTPFFGIHPWYITEAAGSNWEKNLSARLKIPGTCAGEMGLDRSYAAKNSSNNDMAIQEKYFIRQLELAFKYGSPLSIHCVHAWENLFDCLDKILGINTPLPVPAILHYFMGSREIADRLIESGFYLSFAPGLHRAGKKRINAFRHCNPDKMLLETDSSLGGSKMLLTQHYNKCAELLKIPGASLIRIIEKNGQIFKNKKNTG